MNEMSVKDTMLQPGSKHYESCNCKLHIFQSRAYIDVSLLTEL